MNSKFTIMILIHNIYVHTYTLYTYVFSEYIYTHIYTHTDRRKETHEYLSKTL